MAVGNFENLSELLHRLAAQGLSSGVVSEVGVYHCGKLESSHEQTSKSSLLVWRLAVGSHPPGGGKETVGFWIWWRLAKGNIPPGDGDEIRSLLEHVRLAVWVVPPGDG
ncbi:hypothetical protein DEO72_LG2g3255 [Vigna unguiculata]|uniref:Uncharacterized protein n=1 Tax=Vigna unguiculata TaxID=3917 RepID=A0A4D6L336_VIGUN|nr:hypothetical protein DEO72_LG2g3255 [Vigna unguiculata]